MHGPAGKGEFDHVGFGVDRGIGDPLPIRRYRRVRPQVIAGGVDGTPAAIGDTDLDQR
jgi:hypothetical protein